MTTYIIFRKNDDPPVPEGVTPAQSWEKRGGTIEASSAPGALRKANLAEGVYVAVPERSWKPLPVKVNTKTVVTIG